MGLQRTCDRCGQHLEQRKRTIWAVDRQRNILLRIDAMTVDVPETYVYRQRLDLCAVCVRAMIHDAEIVNEEPPRRDSEQDDEPPPDEQTDARAGEQVAV